MNLSLAFVDIETTGSHFDRDRITEIGVISLTESGVENWDSLINPGTSIPENIQTLTGINHEMVRDAPSFDEIAHELHDVLSEKIFVAHNARFDFGFIKASFKRLGIEFKPKVLCTVQLSRALFPEYPRHNLDSIIQRLNLSVTSRHRALGDADLLLQFWQKCVQQFGLERLEGELQHLIHNASLPPHIDKDLVEQIPDTPGVYIFYGEKRVPLYIGKSIQMRTRVMSHFQNALTNRKEMKIALQVKDIDWIETGGEIGALLLESNLIKQHLPLMNIKLRRSKDLCAWRMQPQTDALTVPELVTHKQLEPGLQDHLFGLFYSKREAQECLLAIAKKHQLCLAALGLEKTAKGKSCFAYQVKKCKGVCVGDESMELHNLRLATAFQAFKVKVWPYPGPIAIREGGSMYVVDKWCYLGAARNEEELSELSEEGIPDFDLDIYKILKKALVNLPSDRVISLPTV
jgi:DNA polymerase III subunit epsilon